MSEKNWINKKKTDKKFYGYTGPVKPEKKSKWINKKSDTSNSSYGYTEIVKQKKEPTTWIKKKKK